MNGPQYEIHEEGDVEIDEEGNIGVAHETNIIFYSLLGWLIHISFTELGLNFFGNCHGRSGAGTQW